MTDGSDSFPVPGDLFQGRYKVERVIGRGGFSRVYLATQTDLGRKVALKIMRPAAKPEEDQAKSAATIATLSERFLQEARVVANLRGPYTVTVHDHGRTDDGHLFMVLEYVDGIALSSLVKEQGALDPSRVKKILEQTLESLQEAHAHGLLHRDIKPANIMVYEHLGKPDNVKVLDFGIAKVVGQQIDTSNHDDLTQSGSLLGTPRYMSPEQLRGHELTGATDIYSLGLVAFEMLMGKKAIDTHSSMVIIGAQLDPRPFAVPNVPNIPAGLRMVVNRMLSKDLADRYSTVGEVLTDLQNIETGTFPSFPARGRLFTPVGDLPDISDSIELIDVEEVDLARSTTDAPGRKIVVFGSVGVVALLLVVGYLGFQLTRSTSTQQGQGEIDPAAAAELPDPEESTVAAVTPPPKEVGVGTSPTDEPADEAPAVTEILVSTIPSAATIFVNGEHRGPSPVTLPADGVKFPAKIRAVAEGGGERLTVVDAIVPHVEIDLTIVAKAAQPSIDEPKKSNGRGTAAANKTPKPRADTKPKPRPKPKPEPTEPEDEPRKLTLPALDY